jgi:hypothetical protein
VVCATLVTEQAGLVARVCDHRSIPCPARKLELVVYRESDLRQATDRPSWQLNLNTGLELHRATTDPTGEPAHWYILDLAFARRHAIALIGPDAVRVIADPGADAVDRAMSEMAIWFAEHEPGWAATAAACRAWHWRATGQFAGKRAAVVWAAERCMSEKGAHGKRQSREAIRPGFRSPHLGT